MRIQAFPAIANGGVFVATGDIDRDGFADVIVGTQGPRPAQVRVFSGRRGNVLADFYAFEDGVTPAATPLPLRVHSLVATTRVFGPARGGLQVAARVAGGDVDGDGFADVMVASGEGVKPRIEVYSGKLLTDAAAAAKIVSIAVSSTPGAGWNGNGAFVAAADMNGDGRSEIVVSFDGSPVVSVVNPRNGSVLSSLDLTTLPGGLRYGQGARIAARAGRIAIATGPGVAPSVRVLAFEMIGAEATWSSEPLTLPRLGAIGKNGLFIG